MLQLALSSQGLSRETAGTTECSRLESHRVLKNVSCLQSRAEFLGGQFQSALKKLYFIHSLSYVKITGSHRKHRPYI